MVVNVLNKKFQAHKIIFDRITKKKKVIRKLTAIKPLLRIYSRFSDVFPPLNYEKFPELLPEILQFDDRIEISDRKVVKIRKIKTKK